MGHAYAAAEAVLVAKFLRFCRFCEQETPHEIRHRANQSLVVCARCRERALLEDLDRD